MQDLSHGSTIYLSPEAPVLMHDRALTADGIDVELWSSTIAFPLIRLTSAGTDAVLDSKAHATELRGLFRAGQELGVAQIRTRILSRRDESDGLVVLRTARDRFSADGLFIGPVSIVWTVKRFGKDWRIVQIHFDDEDMDPSLMSRLPSQGHQP